MAQHAFRRREEDHAPSDPTNSEKDQHLIDAVRRGDAFAFEQLFTAYYDVLCDFVHSYLRSRDATEDLIQDLFASIWENRDRWLPNGTIRQYLFKAARNRALSHLRHAVVVRRFEDISQRESLASIHARYAERADDSICLAELTAAFEAAVRALPERRRRVLLLRWSGGMSHAEIARVLGISVKGVETQLGRAMRSIREQLIRFQPPS